MYNKHGSRVAALACVRVARVVGRGGTFQIDPSALSERVPSGTGPSFVAPLVILRRRMLDGCLLPPSLHLDYPSSIPLFRFSLASCKYLDRFLFRLLISTFDRKKLELLFEMYTHVERMRNIFEERIQTREKEKEEENCCLIGDLS